VAEIEHLGQLKHDTQNARKHNPRNIGMVADGLQEVGAARSIVIDEDGVILAGNGVVEAAGQVGIEKVKVVDADGETIVAVRRSGLTPEQKTRLALLDNRTAELAEWDTDILAELQDQDEALLAGLFESDELDKLLGEGGGRYDRTLEEIDLAQLPSKPVWVLMAVPMAKTADVEPLLEQIESLGIQVERSNG
jgi:hypothetical protein